MLAGLKQRPSLQPLLPYVRRFYDSDSTYVWQDAQVDSASPREASKATRSCPRPAIAAVNTQLREGEAARPAIWNAAGEEPADISDLRGRSEEPIWTGDWAFPRDRQDLLVLGRPLGTDACLPSLLRRGRRSNVSSPASLMSRLLAVAAFLRRGSGFCAMCPPHSQPI